MILTIHNLIELQGGAGGKVSVDQVRNAYKVAIRFSTNLLILIQGGSTGKVCSNIDRSLVLASKTVPPHNPKLCSISGWFWQQSKCRSKLKPIQIPCTHHAQKGSYLFLAGYYRKGAFIPRSITGSDFCCSNILRSGWNVVPLQGGTGGKVREIPDRIV